MNLIYEKTTEKSFESAVSSLISALKDRKFGVLWKLNFKDKLKEHELEFSEDFMVLEVCNPQKAKEVLDLHLEMGYFLPCKMVVYSSNGSVKVGMANPEALVDIAGYPDLSSFATEVQIALRSAIDSAI